MMAMFKQLFSMITLFLSGTEKYMSGYAKGGEWIEAQMSLFAEEAEHERVVKRIQLQQKIDAIKAQQVAAHPNP